MVFGSFSGCTSAGHGRTQGPAPDRPVDAYGAGGRTPTCELAR